MWILWVRHKNVLSSKASIFKSFAFNRRQIFRPRGENVLSSASSHSTHVFSFQGGFGRFEIYPGDLYFLYRFDNYA